MADTTKAAKAAEGAAALKVHHLRPAPGARSAKIRVGRGEGGRRGKTAGRGTKGTKARYQVPEGFQGGTTPLHMRFPKLRGFKNPFRTEYQVVNLDRLSALYPQGGDVSVEDLVAKGAVRGGQLVKVLGSGEISVAVNVTADAFSGSAKQKIEAAGGSARTAGPAPMTVCRRAGSRVSPGTGPAAYGVPPTMPGLPASTGIL